MAATCNTTNQRVFSYIKSEESAYWLGFIYSKGYFVSKSSIRITVPYKDEQMLLNLRKYLATMQNIHDKLNLTSL